MAAAAKHRLERCGIKIFEEVYDVLNATDDEIKACKARCARHKQMCPLLGHPCPQDPVGQTVGLVAGMSCFDWSRMGKRKDWLGESTTVLVQFLHEFLRLRPHWAVFECVPQFDEKTA